MSTLADLRLRFVDIIGRLDFLTGGKATNTDNGANDFLQRAVRELDLQAFYLSGGDKNRKFVKVLAEGDYTFTIPEFLELDGLRMVTATGERDMTDGRLDLREFRNRHNRPYSDWSNGTPFDWAINDDILQAEQESAVPEDSLGQQDTRVITPVQELLQNPSFDDKLANTLEPGSFAETGAEKFNDARYWDRIDTKVQYDSTNKTMVVDGSFTALDAIILQDISNMVQYPTLDRGYTLSIVISGYSSGAVTLAIGDAISATIDANGTWSVALNPSVYTSSNFRVYATVTESTDLTIDSVSMKLIDDKDKTSVSASIPFDDIESRKGIIFFPPTDEARTVEVHGKFFTPKMTRDTDVNFWSTMLPDLVAFKAAELYYSDLGNSTRVKHFMGLIAERIDKLDSKDALQEDNDAAGINQQPFRGVPEKWKA